jgi:hypothetical protein
MTERLVPLLAAQVARVRSPVPARPTITVEKLALFDNQHPGGGTFSSTAIEIINRSKFVVSKAKVFPHHEDREEFTNHCLVSILKRLSDELINDFAAARPTSKQRNHCLESWYAPIVS